MRPLFPVISVFCGFMLLPATVGAQSISLTAGQPSYTESFDSLPTNVAVAPWRNADQTTPTLAGWYAEVENIALGTFNLIIGPGTSGAFYNFGSNNASDRALGAQSSGTPGAIAWGVRLVNDSGQTISGFSVDYTGEQWRTVAGGVQNKQQLYYRIGGTTFDLQSNTGSWTAHTGGDFSALHFGSGGALDGNNAANRTAISTTVTASVADGAHIWIGWLDVNESGADQGLGVDDLTVAIDVPNADAGVSDAGSASDASTLDASTTADANTTADATAAIDGGVNVDAASNNADGAVAVVDAGGDVVDASGTIDALLNVDSGSAGSPDAGENGDDDDGGCCSTQNQTPSPWELSLVLLVGVLLRRRRR